MLRFSKRVRISLAAQFIKLSWLGSAAFGFFGWMNEGSGIVVVGIVLWWLTFQVFGHALLAFEDGSDGDSSDSG